MEFNAIYLYNNDTNIIKWDFFLILTCNDYYSTWNQIILQKLVFIDGYVIDFTNQHVSVIIKNLKNIKSFYLLTKNVIFWECYSEPATSELPRK